MDMMKLHDLNQVAFIAGRSHIELAQKIANLLQINLHKCTIAEFGNAEIMIKIEENVREKNVYIFQTDTIGKNENGERISPNDYFIEMLLLLDAANRADANIATVITPSYFYARQERKTAGREPISAKVTANCIAVHHAKRLITMDLHAQAIQGFLEIPVDNLYAIKWLVAAYRHHVKNNISSDDYITLAPDAGGVPRARWMSEYLGLKMATAYKVRVGLDKPEVLDIAGDIKYKKCLTPDDIISSGGTLVELAEKAVDELRAKEIIPLVTHPSPKKDSLEKILNSDNIKTLVIANTVPIDYDVKIPYDKTLIIVDVSPIFAAAICMIENRESLSKVFQYRPSQLGLSYEILTSSGRELIVPEEDMVFANSH